jgi:hypothetical protein
MSGSVMAQRGLAPDEHMSSAAGAPRRVYRVCRVTWSRASRSGTAARRIDAAASVILLAGAERVH